MAVFVRYAGYSKRGSASDVAVLQELNKDVAGCIREVHCRRSGFRLPGLGWRAGEGEGAHTHTHTGDKNKTFSAIQRKHKRTHHENDVAN